MLQTFNLEPYLTLLQHWALQAEGYWYLLPDQARLGCYGTGYNNWGVQTNQKYLGAMAVLSELGEQVDSIPASQRTQARERALAALRFSLRSHLSGDLRCTDGTQWGHTWISALGIERMMHGVYLLEPYFTAEDHALLRRVLTSEADWIHHHHQRGAHKGVFANPWNHSGQNAPESNLWNGALLWRAAVTYPDHPGAAAWQEQAHRFLMNSVSVAADAEDERIVAGRPVKAWHVGAGFFPNYALDHHGYLNVGYMVICLSNAAMLHFDLQAKGLPMPESLYHHQADLWQVVRRMIFSDGRLARIGGDSRLRYTYCQEYLLPTLVFAAGRLGETEAAHLLAGQLQLIQQEAAFSEDGSFYGKRLAALAESSPYYYTRLESDRACVLGMTARYLRQLQTDAEGSRALVTTTGEAFENSVAGPWCDPDHGAVLQRSPARLAAFAWRAHGLAQGLCQPPDDGHLAEWSQNLAGQIRFLGDDGVIEGGQTTRRRLLGYQIDTFEGGFVTSGAVMEGVGLTLAEGWRGEESGLHQLAFVALPDGHTVVGLQHCRTVNQRTYLAEVKGLHLNLPNDLYNDFKRSLATAQGTIVLTNPPGQDRFIELASPWANIDGRVGVVGLYGAEQLVVHQAKGRRGGKYASLYVDEICFHCHLGTQSIEPNTVILDVGWAILADVNRAQTDHFAQRCASLPIDEAGPDIRGVRVQGLDGRLYTVLANFGQSETAYPTANLISLGGSIQDLVTGDVLVAEQKAALRLKPNQVYIFRIDH